MKIKKSIIGLSSLGLLATAAPVSSSIVTNQVTFDDSQSMQMECIDVGDKLIELKSINKSCEELVTVDKIERWGSYGEPFFRDLYLDSRVKVEEAFGDAASAKDGKIERDDLFTHSRTDTQYTSYNRYKSNNVEKNNHTSWGNATKYQLNVTVPAKTDWYIVQVVADVKIKNCLEGSGRHDITYSFAQAKLSPLSTSPTDILMPYIGINEHNLEDMHTLHEDFEVKTGNDFFKLFENWFPWEQKPYGEATLSSTIALSNRSSEDKEVPIYFWYGFFGGGYKGRSSGSHINCSEVTFSANRIL